MKLYINNNLEIDEAYGFSSSNNVPLTFGAGSFSGIGNWVPIDGIMDEVGIWSRTLTSTEISDLYNSGDGLAYISPIVYCNFSGYAFDEDDTALVGANVTVWNQFNVSEYYQNTTIADGKWSVQVPNSTNTYMAGSYYNNTLIGQLKPYISGTC